MNHTGVWVARRPPAAARNGLSSRLIRSRRPERVSEWPRATCGAGERIERPAPGNAREGSYCWGADSDRGRAARVLRPLFRWIGSWTRPGSDQDGMTQQHPELADEQAHVDFAYECLE